MGLGNFIEDNTPSNKDVNRFSTYSYDEREEDIWDWIEEFQDKFPEEVKCDLVEVAPRDVSYHAQAYWRKRGDTHYQYLRVSETAFDDGEWFARSVVLHEMCHLYMYQIGMRDVTERSPMFSWLLGRVGAHVSGMRTEGDQWQEMERFLPDDLTSRHEPDTDDAH